MFTVKWIASNGAEMIYNARDVSYTPGNWPSDTPQNAKVSFYITGQQSNVDGDSHCVLDSGHVYVMNANGRTVGSYILSTDGFPHGLAPKQAA